MSGSAHDTGPDRGLVLVPVLELGIGLGLDARERLTDPGLAGCRREQQQW